MTPEPETPWALLKRLRAEGHPNDVVVSRLKALGLEDDDVKVLMLEAPPAASGLEMPDALKVAAVIAAGPMLGGLLVASMSEPVAPREPPPPQVALAADDTSPRCPDHRERAAVGTCPRCGSFVCRACAGAQLAWGCVKCQGLPAVQQQRLAELGRKLAIVGFVGVAAVATWLILWAAGRYRLVEVIFAAVVFCAVPTIFSALQLIRPARWAAIVVMVWDLLLGGYLFLWGGGLDHLVGLAMFVVFAALAALVRGFAVSESRGSAPAGPARPAA